MGSSQTEVVTMRSKGQTDIIGRKLKMKQEAIKKWILEHIHESIGTTIEALNVRLAGHYRHYRVSENISEKCLLGK